MDEIGVGEIENIVGIKLVMAFGARGAAHRLPAFVGEPGEVRDQRLVGAIRLAHPDPQQIMRARRADRPAPTRGGTTPDLVRVEDAGAGAVEPQAVIGALQGAIDDLAVTERREAVGAAAGYGTGDSVAVAEQRDRLVEEGLGKRGSRRSSSAQPATYQQLRR